MFLTLLCAGYGTRLAKDLESEENESYTHLIGIPKPLLPIHCKPLIQYWIDISLNISQICHINIVTNEAHKEKYETLVKQYENDCLLKMSIISDKSCTNETRIGAIACMHLGASSSKDDSIFIAGDTLLDESFHLEDMIEKFKSLKCKNENVCLVISAPVLCEEDVSKHGIIEVDKENRVTSFLEKPKLYETSSRLQSPCFYIMDNYCINLIDKFLYEAREKPLSARDATGHLIKFLVSDQSVSTFAYNVTQRFDIGNLKSYIDCCEKFK